MGKGMKGKGGAKARPRQQQNAQGSKLRKLPKQGRAYATAANPQRLALGAPAQRYLAALTHPFTKQAEGARVPEPYAINTVTRKVHQPIIITTDVGGGFDLAVQPHLITSYVSFKGSISGGAGAFSPFNMPAGMTVRSAVSTNALAELAVSYRIVAMGVRLKTNIDFTKAGGRIYGAVLPATVEMPWAFDTGINLSNAAKCFDIPFDGSSISTGIVNLPRGFQFTTAELMAEGGAEVVFPICGAAATTFLEGNSNQYEQRTSVFNATGVGSAAVALGFMQAAGFSQLVLRGEGLQPSTDVFTAEVIYHVELVPNVSSGGTLVEAMPYNNAPSGPHEVHAVHAALTRMKPVDYVKTKMQGVGREIGHLANSKFMRGVDGLAEKVFGLAVRNLA